MSFVIGEKTISSKKIIMISFQKRNDLDLYERFFKTEEFHNIIYNLEKGEDISNVIDELAKEETSCVCWVYNTEQDYKTFKKKNSNLFENNWQRYWFFENQERRFDVQRVFFPFQKEEKKDIEEEPISDFRRRQILDLPMPSKEETDFKLVHCVVPYSDRKKAQRFFKYPLFRKAVMKMRKDQVEELVLALNIKGTTGIYYFNSKEDLETEMQDFGRYGAICHFFWTKDRQKK